MLGEGHEGGAQTRRAHAGLEGKLRLLHTACTRGGSSWQCVWGTSCVLRTESQKTCGELAAAPRAAAGVLGLLYHSRTSCPASVLKCSAFTIAVHAQYNRLQAAIPQACMRALVMLRLRFANSRVGHGLCWARQDRAWCIDCAVIGQRRRDVGTLPWILLRFRITQTSPITHSPWIPASILRTRFASSLAVYGAG